MKKQAKTITLIVVVLAILLVGYLIAKRLLARSYYTQAVAHATREQYDDAIAFCSKAIEMAPGYANAYYSRGRAYTCKGQYDRAIRDFNRSIEIHGGPASYYGRALAYYHVKEYDRAIADYGRAIELNPRIPEVFSGRARAYYRKGCYHRAVSDSNKAIELRDDFALAYYRKALALEELGRPAEAIDAYKSFIENANPSQRKTVRYATQRIEQLQARKQEVGQRSNIAGSK